MKKGEEIFHKTKLAFVEVELAKATQAYREITHLISDELERKHSEDLTVAFSKLFTEAVNLHKKIVTLKTVAAECRSAMVYGFDPVFRKS